MVKHKLMLPVLAAIVGVAGAFCTKTVSAHQDSYYWFPLDESTGAPQPVTTLIQQSTDPANCPTLGSKYCEGAYDTYVENQDGTYSASGAREITHKKNP